MTFSKTKKTHEDLYFLLEDTPSNKVFVWSQPKKGLMIFEKFVGKSRTKAFQESLGIFVQKSFAPPNIFLLLHLWTWESLNWNLNKISKFLEVSFMIFLFCTYFKQVIVFFLAYIQTLIYVNLSCPGVW